MQVRDLIEKLMKVDADLEIFQPSEDHSYERIHNAFETDIERWDEQDYFGEYYNEEGMIEGAYKIRGIIIS